ncbi:MAG TPA: hypothetical protein VJV79_38650, partial [Polyangiaceae bacterium]|nr:hypothetical protein [Polyangiaceae bacterium]
MRRFEAYLLCGAGLAYAGRASAQPTAPIELKWNALESCPSADSVLARVHKIAGSTRATPNTLRAEATITQPSDGLFRLRLEIHYGELGAVRNIEGKSCKDLAGAAAVALALLLSSEEPLSERDLAGTSATGANPGGDAGRNQQATSPNPPTTPPNQPAPPPGDSAATASNPASGETGPPRRWRLLLVAPLGALSFGPLQQVSRGLGVAAGLSFDRWRFLAEGKLWASQRETTVSNLGDEYAVELDRFTVGARGCRSVFGARFEFAPCMLMSVHHLSVRGTGRNLVSSADTVTWASVGIGAHARLLITPWVGLIAGVD